MYKGVIGSDYSDGETNTLVGFRVGKDSKLIEFNKYKRNFPPADCYTSGGRCWGEGPGSFKYQFKKMKYLSEFLALYGSFVTNYKG